MIDQAAIFTEITQRNALRRQAGLPLLNVRAEYEHALARALWNEAFETYAVEITRIREDVLADYRQRHEGRTPHSAAERMGADCRMMARITAFLKQRGVHPPGDKHPICYGAGGGADLR